MGRILFFAQKFINLVVAGYGGWIVYRLCRYLRSYLYSAPDFNAKTFLAPHQVRDEMQKINSQFRCRSRRAIVVHLYYSELISEILQSQLLQNEQLDLHISLGPQVHSSFFTQLEKYSGAVALYQFENKGRDVFPFLKVYSTILPYNYEWLCKLHSKRSPQIRDGELWRKDLFCDLLSIKTFNILSSSSQRIISPRQAFLPVALFLDGNEARMREILKRLNLEVSWDFLFIAGTMFWFRPEGLRQLLQLQPFEDLFEPERDTLDGLTAHAFERLFFYIVQCSDDAV